MLQVAFAGTFSATLEPSVRARLTMPCDVVMGDETGIVSRLGDVDVLVTLAFNREMAAAAKNLKLVQVPGAGLDRIDRSALPAGASLANVYGHEVGIAEYVLGAMLALTRSFCRIDASLRRGVWESQWGVGGSPPAPWPELAGKTLGILGYGRIGQALARRARAFDMDVKAFRRRPLPSGVADVRMVSSLEEVLTDADHVVVAAPYTPKTHHLIDADAFSQMRKGVHLVNIARGGLVDQDALRTALDDGTVAMATLDTVDPEPLPAGHWLFTHPRVRVSSHVSWSSPAGGRRIFELFLENLGRQVRGEPLEGVVDKDERY